MGCCRVSLVRGLWAMQPPTVSSWLSPLDRSRRRCLRWAGFTAKSSAELLLRFLKIGAWR